MNLENSKNLLQKAKNLIPACTQTFSKGPTQFVQGVAPNFVLRGEGCKIWDVDGNEYIDYTMGLGPAILGYNYRAVNEAIISQLRDGITFTLPHKIEVELAEILVDTLPCAEMVRYGKNGSDATSGAIRAARAFTGREKIACCGYHGWQDWYIGTTTRNKGVPKCVSDLTFTFEYIISDKGNWAKYDFRKRELSYSIHGEIFKESYSDYDVNQTYIEEMRHFIKCIAEHRTPITNLYTAKKTLKVCLLSREGICK